MEGSGSHGGAKQQQRVFVVVGSCRAPLGAIGSHWESLGAVGVNYVSLPNQSKILPVKRPEWVHASTIAPRAAATCSSEPIRMRVVMGWVRGVTNSRHACEAKESEGIRRNQKDSEGIKRTPKESEGLRRNQKDSEGLRRRCMASVTIGT